jgi:hypothetical protein
VSYLRRFVRFLYDFLVGDAWELFVGPVLALVVAWSLIQAGLEPAVVGGLLIASVVGVVVVHLAVAVRSAS